LYPNKKLIISNATKKGAMNKNNALEANAGARSIYKYI
jgi:hypothetical protein